MGQIAGSIEAVQETDGLDGRAAKLAEIIHRFIAIRRRLRPVRPEQVASENAELNALLPHGKDWERQGFDEFVSMGEKLSRQPEPMTMSELGEALDVPLDT